MIFLTIFCLFVLSSSLTSSIPAPYSALACRPDMLRLLPTRVQEICALLALVKDGKAKRQDMTAASAVGDEDAPEHLFLRFGRAGRGWGEKIKAMTNLENFIVER